MYVWKIKFKDLCGQRIMRPYLLKLIVEKVLDFDRYFRENFRSFLCSSRRTPRHSTHPINIRQISKWKNLWEEFS